MHREPLEVELVSCKCGHEFEAFHNDLGTYMCPECFDKNKVSPKDQKTLDVALKELEEELPYPWGRRLA